MTAGSPGSRHAPVLRAFVLRVRFLMSGPFGPNVEELKMTAHRKTQAAKPLRLLPLLMGCAFAFGGACSAVAAEPALWAPGRVLVQPKPGLPDAELEKI